MQEIFSWHHTFEAAMNFTPIIDAARCRLAQLTEQQAARPSREGGWSRKQILGHLIDSASNNHQRFVRAILDGGLSEWPSYEQERWVAAGGYQDLPWTELIDLWSSYNRLLSHFVSRMPESALEFRCRVGGQEMTLGELTRSYVTHMEHHLTQILD
jgi:hypothetical protein